LDALKARPVPGRLPKLSGAQLARLYTLVVGNDPRQLRFVFALWTRATVRELIRREFGVRLSEVSVGRLPRKLGLSPQRPLCRAWQQNPEAVARWKVEEYPAIRAQAAEVVPDGHPAHRSNAVKQFAASTGGRLRLFFLPGYSPELNPDEWVWKNVKVRHDAPSRRAG
jgi:transposase